MHFIVGPSRNPAVRGGYTTCLLYASGLPRSIEAKIYNDLFHMYSVEFLVILKRCKLFARFIATISTN
jgi:hypothetical protein